MLMISMNPPESLLGNLWPPRIFLHTPTHIYIVLETICWIWETSYPCLGELGPIWWKCMKSYFNRKNDITPVYCDKSMHAQKLSMLRLLIKTKHHNLKNRDSIILGTQVTDKAYGPLYFNLTSFLCALHENPMT